jgi:hypothetical protein
MLSSDRAAALAPRAGIAALLLTKEQSMKVTLLIFAEAGAANWRVRRPPGTLGVQCLNPEK